jgi:hypothetical protein
MLTKLDSYIKFHKNIDSIIKSFDNTVSEIYEMESDIEKFLEIGGKQKVPGIDIGGKSIYALLYTIMANTKANRSHYIALKARIESLSDFINLANYS